MPTASSGPTAITVPTGSSGGGIVTIEAYVFDIITFGVLDSIASALGRALAALEVLSALSDAFQREYLSSVEISQGIYYNELEKLCLRHGYTKEDNT